MFLTGWEVVDIVFMVLAGGFIFQHFLQQQLFVATADSDHPEHTYNANRQWWLTFKIACLIAAIAIVLHEFGHKIAALYFGLNASMHAPYLFLAIAVVLVLLRSPIIFFIGGYVEYACNQLAPSASCILAAGYYYPSSWSVMWIALWGPLVNLIIFLICYLMLSNKKTTKWLKKKGKYHIPTFIMLKQVNLFLFIFNMIPIPGFDGWGVFSNLWTLIFH